jgi:hypothetical protein
MPVDQAGNSQDETGNVGRPLIIDLPVFPGYVVELDPDVHIGHPEKFTDEAQIAHG